MSKGKKHDDISIIFQDNQTNLKIRQITTAKSIHHHPFFMINSYNDKMDYLFFISHRTGAPQIFFEERKTKNIIQLTDIENLNEWSIHPSSDGKFVYFTTNDGGYRVLLDGFRVEKIIDFSKVKLKTDEMITTGMGTTALSKDNKYWAIKYIMNGVSYIEVIDTDTLKSDTILECLEVSHMQFCPDDNKLLFYAGPLTDRVWSVNRDGSNNRRLHFRDKENKQWVTHETFIANNNELAFVDWNKGVKAINLDTLGVRNITELNAWHAVANNDGTMMVADTNFPDNGLFVFDPRKSNGNIYKLCNSNSSNKGEHWNGPFPYDNGPIKVDAPQHTHPHPSFSPDNKFVVFTSDKSGYSQIYEILLPENIKELI